MKEPPHFPRQGIEGQVRAGGYALQRAGGEERVVTVIRDTDRLAVRRVPEGARRTPGGFPPGVRQEPRPDLAGQGQAAISRPDVLWVVGAGRWPVRAWHPDNVHVVMLTRPGPVRGVSRCGG